MSWITNFFNFLIWFVSFYDSNYFEKINKLRIVKVRLNFQQVKIHPPPKNLTSNETTLGSYDGNH